MKTTLCVLLWLSVGAVNPSSDEKNGYLSSDYRRKLRGSGPDPRWSKDAADGIKTVSPSAEHLSFGKTVRDLFGQLGAGLATWISNSALKEKDGEAKDSSNKNTTGPAKGIAFGQPPPSYGAEGNGAAEAKGAKKQEAQQRQNNHYRNTSPGVADATCAWWWAWLFCGQ